MALEPEPPQPSVFQVEGDKLFYNLDKLVEKGSIYEHQSLAVKAIRRDLDTPTEGDFSNVSLVVLPTGSGKTGVGVMAAYVCKARRVLVVTPSEAISKQQLTQFKVVGDSNRNPLNKKPFLFERGIFPSYNHLLPSGQCVLETMELRNVLCEDYQLVVTNAHKFGDGSGRGVDIKEFPRDYFSLVIVDEAHHFPAQTWKNIVDRFSEVERILFLTATPLNRGEYILQDKSPCYVLSHEDAVKRGIIRETRFIERSFHYDGILPPPDEYIILPVLDAVKVILTDHDSQDPKYSHKAMVLAENKEHASLIAYLWNARYKEFGECHTFIQDDKVSHVNDFTTKTKKRVLVVIYRLTEGFDCKEVSVVAILRNVSKRSRVYFAQFVGRAVRKLHRDDRVIATVISSTHYKQGPNFDAFKNNVLPPDIREDPSLAKEKDIESD